MDYPCTRFGDFSFSRIGFIMRTDRETERQTDGQTDGRTDRQTDRQTPLNTVLPQLHWHWRE